MVYDSNFIKPLQIHKTYGAKDIPGITVLDIKRSSLANKKYAITISYNGQTSTVNYGDKRYQQYEDRTPLGIYHNLDHHDDNRRNSYLARASKIKNHQGLAVNDPFSPDRYALITLW